MNTKIHSHAINEFGNGVILGGGSTVLAWLSRNPDRWNTFTKVNETINNR